MTPETSQTPNTANPQEAKSSKSVSKQPKASKTSKASKDEIVDLVLNKNLTQDQTAQLTGYSQQRISQIMSEAKNNPDVLLFRSKKDLALEGLQATIVNNISDEDIKKANLQSKIWSVGVLQDKIANLRGQAGIIIGYDPRVVAAGIAELRGMIQAVPVHDSQSVIEADCYKTLEHGSDE